jgi:hypothetical protein
MVTSITWQQYFTAIGILTALYYATICWRYYKNDISRLLALNNAENQTSFSSVPAQSRQQANGILPLVHELVAAIDQLIRDGAVRHWGQEELFFGIQRILKDYPAVRGTEFAEKINQHIQEEVIINGMMPMNEEVFKRLWLV